MLASRKWSGKTLTDHARERAEFVRQLLERAHVRPGYAVDDGPHDWEKTRPGDPDLPSRPALLLAAIAERQRWQADYRAAQALAGAPPDIRSATRDQAA